MTIFEYLMLGIAVAFTGLHADGLSQIREKLRRIAVELEKLNEESPE